MINNTAFEIQIVDRDSGNINVPANSTIVFKGDTRAAVEIRYKIRFNVAAPTTDFLVFLLSQINSYGNAE